VAELRGQKFPILAHCVKHSTIASFWFQLEIAYLMLALNLETIEAVIADQ